MTQLRITTDSGMAISSVTLTPEQVEKFGNVESIVNVLKHSAGFQQNLEQAQSTIRTLENRWNSHVEALTEAVMEHEACCGSVEGKRDFLDNLGLELPAKNFTITLTFELSDEAWGDDESNIADQISDVIESYASAFGDRMSVESYEKVD